MNPNDWLGRWEPPVYHGKHDRKIPENYGRWYQYDPLRNGNAYYPVIRAIPVDGSVDGLTWRQSPQVRFWLDPPHRTLWQRFLDWLQR